MAHDISIEADVIPVLDVQAANALVRRIQKLGNRVVSSNYTKAAQELESLSKVYTASQVVSGRASTTTQARIQLEQLAQLRGNSFALARVRAGSEQAKLGIRSGNVMPYAPFSEKQIARWTPDLASVSSSYNELLTKYSAFKQSPSETNKNELLKVVENINAQLANVSKGRKDEIKTFSKIQKDTKAIGKEVSGWQATTKPSGTANALGAVSFFKKGLGGLLRLFGITSLLAGIRKLGGMGVQGIQEGYNDLVEQSIYGANRNIAKTRSLSKMYGIKEESLTGAEHYAMDFRQRMIMGEVSDQEFIALSKMGALGQMIVSGRAGKNPEEFHKALQEYIRANQGNEAEVRQNLRWLGLNPDIMAYGALEHDPSREAMVESTYKDLVRANKESAVATLIPSQIIKTVEDEIKKMSADAIRTLTTGIESETLFYKSVARGGGFTPEEQSVIYNNLERKKQSYGFDPNNPMANTMSLGFRMTTGNFGSVLYERRVQAEIAAAESIKESAASMKDSVKEGVIEGFSATSKGSSYRSNSDNVNSSLSNSFNPWTKGAY